MFSFIYNFSNIFYKKASDQILFNDLEQKILSLLLNVVSEKSPSTILRIAGGFVRDKLLGKESNDIDIAVDNMTGEQFANLVIEYMRENNLDVGDLSVVQANPDQSKHLATAMVKIFGVPIDFVNLRTEVYNDSRIPDMQFGSAKEDAERRDLTINSLFYNINTGEVEDFVGGTEDLRKGIARTPLDSVKTFLDDPLRILRAIRFAAKYNLELDPSLIEAAHNPAVKEAFKNKISQERIWTELAGKNEGDKWKPGALIGSNPSKAARLLRQLGLLDLIFDPTDSEKEELGLSEEMVDWETDQNNPHHEFNIYEHTMRVLENLVNQTKEDIKEDHETYLVRNIAALLHDIGKRYKGIQGKHKDKGHTTYINHEEMSGKIAEKVLKRLRAPDRITSRVKKLIDGHLRPHMLLEQGSPKAYRGYVRDFDDWKHSIDLAIADNLGKKNFNESEIPSEIDKYENLRSGISDSIPSGMVGTKIIRPITGNDLIGLGIKQGPIFREIMKAIDEVLLEDPNLSKEDALNMAKQIAGIG